MPKALSTLAVGNKIEIPVNSAFQSRFGSKIVFTVADKNHTGYPSGAVTLITNNIIQILASDGAEPSNSDSSRKTNGNNRHIYSNILSWLNSNANAGAWYSAKHSADAPPSSANVNSGNYYDTWAGFLAMVPAQFVNALMDTTLTVAKATVDGGSYETFTSKMFLASNTEVNLANEGGIAEGVKLALFSDNNSRLAYPTAECVSNSNGYTNANYGTSKAWYWWLRTPYVSYSSSVRYVSPDGTLYNGYAYYGNYGLRPLCNLPSDILVSDTTNASGNYEIIWNTPPTPPTGITVPGSAVSTQPINVSWGASTDPDGDSITYILERRYNSGSYTQVTNTAGLTFTETVSAAWNTIQYRVKARDSFGNESAYVTSGTVAVIHNQPPVISGNNGDLGVKNGDFAYNYTVTDADGDAVTVVEKVGSSTIRSYTVVLGQQNSANVAGNTFLMLSNGQHTLTITATDSANNSAVRTMTFTKQISALSIVLSSPLEADVQPTRANIVVTREIPAGAAFKVEATNNPFDPSPTWEDCTNAVLQGVAFVFTNTVNAALQKGMNVRVTVNRNAAIGACWISGIGGNFE